MNWSSFLEKNYRIHQMATDAASSEKLSTLEKDLILQYLREMYEWMHDNPAMKGNHIAEHIVDQQDLNEEEKWTTDNITFTDPEPEVTEAEFPAEEPVIHQVEIEIPVVQTVVEPVILPEVAPTTEAPASQESVPAPIHHEERTSQTPAVPTKPDINPDIYENLFGDIRMQDLSDKLAWQKIPDLTKAMGINEKILTIQELFKNNQDLFNKTLADLNSLSSFDEAKHYLIDHIIGPMDWAADNKVKKAANFIRLIRRRFV